MYEFIKLSNKLLVIDKVYKDIKNTNKFINILNSIMSKIKEYSFEFYNNVISIYIEKKLNDKKINRQLILDISRLMIVSDKIIKKLNDIFENLINNKSNINFDDIKESSSILNKLINKIKDNLDDLQN